MNTDSLHITDITFSYANSPVKLFDGFSAVFSQGWTVLAGSNGTGKTTLLKLIAGIVKPDSGRVQSADSIYCPQAVTQEPDNFYAAFYNSNNETRALFSRLRITADQYERWDTLSGGEKKRIQLACALSEKPDVLLLDEPTNHLDEQTKSLIIPVLKTYTGIGIIVSHDRKCTDQLCTGTVFLYKESSFVLNGKDSTAAAVYAGGLSNALKIREQESSALRKNWNSLNSKAAAEKTLSRKWQTEAEHSKARLSKKNIASKDDRDAKAKINLARVSGKDRIPGDTKSRFDSRLAQTSERLNASIKTLQRKEGFSINDDDTDRHFTFTIEESAYTLCAEDGSVFSLSVPNLEITQESRIALTGENGCGKTVFIRELIKQLEAKNKAEHILYLPQEISETQASAILSLFAALEPDEKGEVLSTLYRLASEPENLCRRTFNTVSPGELRKLVIAMGIQSAVSFLILDEPTNHLDITSITALENALSNIQCALLVVSHDSAFLKKITVQEWNITRYADKAELKQV